MMYFLSRFGRRFAIVFAIMTIIYNPFFSISHWVIPNGGTATDILLKIIVLLISGGVCIWFWHMTRGALGQFGMIFMSIVLALIAAVPFTSGLFSITMSNIGHMLYFFVLPILISSGLSAGDFIRLSTGTLMTTSTDNNHHESMDMASRGGHNTVHHTN